MHYSESPSITLPHLYHLYKSGNHPQTRPQLFKRWIAPSTGWITIHWIAQLVSPTLICWIAIYPVDSAVQLLNNQGQEYYLVTKEKINWNYIVDLKGHVQLIHVIASKLVLFFQWYANQLPPSKVGYQSNISEKGTSSLDLVPSYFWYPQQSISFQKETSAIRVTGILTFDRNFKK